MVKKLFKFFLLASLMACAKPQGFDSTALRVSLSAEPDLLNPLLASDAYASLILRYVVEDLIERDPDTLEFIPRLAQSWEVSPDHLSYTFNLREGVKWHDGVPFTADDVVFSFERLKDPKTENPFLKVYFDDVVKVEKLSDYKVRFITKRPYFMALSTCGSLPLIPKHLFEGQDFNNNPLNRAPIGTGPYKFEKWQTGRQIVLVRNEDYWREKPAITKIFYEIISDDPIALQVLKKDELDLANLRAIQWVKQTDSKKFNGHFNKYKYLTPGYNYIGWNMANPLFSDKRVREAMTYLVDRKKLLEKINFGLGELVESPFFRDSPQYNPNLPQRLYDPAHARQLLAEAGWKDSDGDGLLDKEGKIFSFKFLYPSASKFTERMAPILKEDLRKVGIEMNIERMEWAAFIGKIEKKDFEATSLGWSTGFESDPYQLWHSSQAEVERGSNFLSFKNKEADEIIEKARTEFDISKRNKLYWRLQEIISDEQPCTFLFNNYSLVVVAKRFTNVIVHKSGLETLEWKVEP